MTEATVEEVPCAGIRLEKKLKRQKDSSGAEESEGKGVKKDSFSEGSSSTDPRAKYFNSTTHGSGFITSLLHSARKGPARVARPLSGVVWVIIKAAPSLVVLNSDLFQPLRLERRPSPFFVPTVVPAGLSVFGSFVALSAQAILESVD